MYNQGVADMMLFIKRHISIMAAITFIFVTAGSHKESHAQNADVCRPYVKNMCMDQAAIDDYISHIHTHLAMAPKLCQDKAQCTRLDNGKCGWKGTPEYSECIAKIKNTFPYTAYQAVQDHLDDFKKCYATVNLPFPEATANANFVNIYVGVENGKPYSKIIETNQSPLNDALDNCILEEFRALPITIPPLSGDAVYSFDIKPESESLDWIKD